MDVKMVKVFKNGQMDRNTKVCGLIITCMEKVNGHSLMGKRRRVFGKGEIE